MTLRHVLRTTLAAGVVAATVVPVWAAPATADHDAPCLVGEVPGSEPLADTHEEDNAAFDRMHVVGAAVAVVSADQVMHTATFGNRSLAPRQRLTAGTHHNVASTTKSMSAALVPTYVDD